MDNNRFYGLVYSSTNECLDAIIQGLRPDYKDRILTAGGSGDQAFAMLWYGAEVVCVDNDPLQVTYIQERRKLLREGDFSRFVQPTEITTERSKKYFGNPYKLKKIREQIDNLEVRGPADIIKIAKSEEGFTKVYLSNVLGYTPKCNRYRISESIIDALVAMAKNLKQGSLVYLSNHGILCDTYPEFADFIKNTDLFWIDTILSNMANKFEKEKASGWDPAVYRVR
ncbi:MAG: hypothetical protein V1914_04670 [archaeon]